MAADWERAITAGGPAWSLLNNIGVARLKLGEFDKAEEALLAASRCPDAEARTYFNLGLVHTAQGRNTTAIAAYEHALTLDPYHFEGLVNLGNLLSSMQQPERALKMYRRAAEVRPGDPSVRFRLAALSGETVPRPPEQAVRQLFDQYAPTFEQSLSQLGYEVPSALKAMYDRLRPGSASCGSLLDLGCGTGLVGSLFADQCEHLVGVDLAPKMIDYARKKACYNSLHANDLNLFLEHTDHRFDLFVAGDVFVYMGDLTPIFAGMTRCAQTEALALFSVETGDTKAYQLRASGRYAHNLQYVFKAGAETGWQPIEHQATTLRMERGRSVAGNIVAMQLKG